MSLLRLVVAELSSYCYESLLDCLITANYLALVCFNYFVIINNASRYVGHRSKVEDTPLPLSIRE